MRKNRNANKRQFGFHPRLPQQLPLKPRVPQSPGRKLPLSIDDMRHKKAIDRLPSIPPARPAPPAFAEPIPDVVSEMMPVPGWFRHARRDDIDVSIVVPMYRSREAVMRQIETWDTSDDGLKKEIIYVDDACPDKSWEIILGSWEAKLGKSRTPIGAVILNRSNCGFARACNIGAGYAKGKYILFLNADTEVVQKDWVRPMVATLAGDAKIGIVGNLIVDNRGEVSSAGSEWDWALRMFLHIGQRSYEGERLHRPFRTDHMPRELLVPGEREMVTAACVMLPREVFVAVDGFDEAYKIGYWEDADLCLKVRTRGYKVFYQPASRVLHVGGHSQAGDHPFQGENAARFREKWIYSGIIDCLVSAKRPGEAVHVPRPTVVACMTVCNRAETLEAAVDSLRGFVTRWVFVVGGTRAAYDCGICDKHGCPTDGTSNIVRRLASTLDCQVLEPPGEPWESPSAMRNAAARYVRTGEWMLLLDGDEVFKQDNLWTISHLMHKYEMIMMRPWTFWNRIDMLGTDTWDGQPHERLVLWKEGYHYAEPDWFRVREGSRLVRETVKCWRGPERLYHHYSWVGSPEKMRRKARLYQIRTGTETSRYVDSVYAPMREGKCDSSVSTHPAFGGGFQRYSGLHPASIQRLVEAGMLT